MKKEIMALIASPEGQYRINNISVLRRWTKNGIGEDVDCLELFFNPINGVEFSGWTKITARDYDGIIEEIEQATNCFLDSVAETLVKNLKAGYRNI